MALGTVKRAAHELRWLPVRLRGRHRINDSGRGVIGFIDIGSAGSLPAPWDTNAYLIRRLLAFEPREPRRDDPYVTALDVAVWESDEERDFYVNTARHGSSLFEQNFEYVREHLDMLSQRGSTEMATTWFKRSTLDHVERVQCRSLDSVLSEVDEPFDFLKIDAQGAEHQILKGAQNFLREQCQGLHLELFSIPMYKGISLKPDVIEWLSGLGFELVHEATPHGTFDCAQDCLFLKSGDSRVHQAVRRAHGLPRSKTAG